MDIHREQLHQLGELLQTIAENPEPVQEDFEAELGRVEVKVSALLEQVETTRVTPTLVQCGWCS